MNKKGLLSLCALLLALVLAFPAVPALAENNAYVKKTDAGRINLRTGASSQYRVLAAIDPGTPLEVLEVEGKWAHVYVQNPQGTGILEGYMYTDYIEYTSGEAVPYYPAQTGYSWQDSTDYSWLSSGQYSFATITENSLMYVCTGNSGRLHLREYAHQDARSLGLYANGTQVIVLNRRGNWAYVYVNGVYGYMMLNYLSPNQYNPVYPISGAVTKYVNTGNSGRLHLREYASQNARSLGLFPNGTKVSAVDLGNGWSYVSFNGYTGFMMTKYLSPTEPYYPSPYVPGEYTLMYVYSATGAKVPLYSGTGDNTSILGRYDNGTAVYVLQNYGTWSLVIVNGAQGYMKNASLSKKPYTPPMPGSPIGTAQVRQPNGSFVYLRSSRSTDSLDNVLAKVPSGAKVTVYQRDEWYSLVQYNGILGYMVSHYLYWGTEPLPTEPSAENKVVKMIVGGTPLRSSRDESSNSNIIMELPHGTMIEILLTYPDNWRYIDFNGVKGYIHGQNVASVTNAGGSLSPLMPEVPAGTVTGTGMVTHPNGSFVNLRYSRSSADNTNVLAQVPSGAKVELMEQYGSWTKVRYNGIVGYMVSSYIVPANSSSSETVPVSVPSTQLTPAQPTVGSVSGAKRVVHNESSGFVYLRSSKDSSNIGNVLMKVYNGTSVDLLRDEGPWSLVNVNGTVGYMVSSYLALEAQYSSSTTGSGTSSQVAPAQPAQSTASGSDEKPASVSSVPLKATGSSSASKPAAVPSTALIPATQTGASASSSRRVVRNNSSNYVYLRSSMDGNIRTNILMKVPNGTVVELLSIEGKWAKVRVNGIEGYMMAAYLKTE